MNSLVFNVNHFLTAVPKSFGEGGTCDAEKVECQFPFKYKTPSGEEKTAENCTNDALYDDNPSKTTEDFHWCATRVNADRTMKEGKWARCEMSTCKESGGNSGGLAGGAIAGIIMAVILAF